MFSWVEFHLKIDHFCLFLPFFAVFGKIGNFLWQPKTMPEYIRKLKVMVVLKTTDQGLSITGLITLLLWCFDRWNFTWKWCIFCDFCRFWSFSSESSNIFDSLKTTLWYGVNLKVMVVLKTADQGLSRTSLITLLSWYLDWWNFNKKLLRFGVFVTIDWVKFNLESAVQCAQ